MASLTSQLTASPPVSRQPSGPVSTPPSEPLSRQPSASPSKQPSFWRTASVETLEPQPAGDAFEARVSVLSRAASDEQLLAGSFVRRFSQQTAPSSGRKAAISSNSPSLLFWQNRLRLFPADRLECSRLDCVGREAVSYTHLTLPTICSV